VDNDKDASALESDASKALSSGFGVFAVSL
jgi:hypothetical protein